MICEKCNKDIEGFNYPSNYRFYGDESNAIDTWGKLANLVRAASNGIWYLCKECDKPTKGENVND